VLRAYGGKPPCGVALFIEGEEESGSAHLTDFLKAEKDALVCDAVIIADSANWRIGQPAITTTLRGNALVTVEVRVSDHAVHSGGFGGAVPDALMAMSRLLASLHDDLGRVAVAGLKTGDADPLDLKEDELRQWVGTRPSVKLIGDGSITSRLWRKPTVSIIGLDATSVKESSNTLWPVATAQLSMRVPPGQDAKAAQDALVKHLETHAPWGAEVKIKRGSTGEAFTGTTSDGGSGIQKVDVTYSGPASGTVCLGMLAIVPGTRPRGGRLRSDPADQAPTVLPRERPAGAGCLWLSVSLVARPASRSPHR